MPSLLRAVNAGWGYHRVSGVLLWHRSTLYSYRGVLDDILEHHVA
jgi:hypothetical protein